MKPALVYLLLFVTLTFNINAVAQNQKDLRIVLIRHAEKPVEGDQLSCEGYNRAVQLPAILVKKFGVPNAVYVPSVNNKKAAKSLRMMETAWPLATKYNLAINSKFDVDDKAALANDLLKKSGVILVVWEHNALPGIIKKLGVNGARLNWPGNDFDSIWIVTLHNGKITFSKDNEHIKPQAGCPF